MEEERRKVYVEVDVTHKTDGTARPRKIKFEDGEVYEIDRVRHCCRAASTKVGGTGLRYTVMICGTETFLFDGVTAAFYKSDEYNSREYRYSNLLELRKAMKHKEGGTNGKAQ